MRHSQDGAVEGGALVGADGDDAAIAVEYEERFVTVLAVFGEPEERMAHRTLTDRVTVWVGEKNVWLAHCLALLLVGLRASMTNRAIRVKPNWAIFSHGGG